MHSSRIAHPLAILLLLAPICWSQESSTEPPQTLEFGSKAAKAERLEYALGHAKALVGTRKRDKAKVVPLDKPLLRWTNPYSNVKDGFLFGWTDELGRPIAVGQIYLLPSSEDTWGVEMQSLSQDAFSVASETNGPWRPAKPGVDWKPVPGMADKPAGSERLRLTQMRGIARRFRADDEFAEEESTLRLLTNPLFRYQDEANGLIDGAVFTLVHGTDPELIISIELRQDKKTKKQSYQYALAPMTGYELRCYLDGNEVWHKPKMSSNRPTDVFWQQNISDAPRRNLLQQLFGL